MPLWPEAVTLQFSARVNGGVRLPADLLASPGMHLEMRIAPQAIQRDERRARAARQPLFGAAVAALLPDGTNHRRNLGRRRTGSQRAPQILSFVRIQAEVPHPVGGQAAAVAVAAERSRGRRDDAEHG